MFISGNILSIKLLWFLVPAVAAIILGCLVLKTIFGGFFEDDVDETGGIDELLDEEEQKENQKTN